MKTIWKFDLAVTDYPAVPMPQGARVLHVEPGASVGGLWLWAEVDTDAPVETRGFRIVGTGHALPAVGRYVGSVLAGQFVWHVYEDPQ